MDVYQSSIESRRMGGNGSLMEIEKKETQSRYGIVNFEKRKHPRFSVDLRVEYCKVGSVVKHDGRAMNASESGLLLYFPEPLQIGQYLSLKLFLPSGFKSSAFETIVQVVWIDMHLEEGWGDYRTGVRLIDTSPEDMSKLKKLLMDLSQ